MYPRTITKIIRTQKEKQNKKKIGRPKSGEERRGKHPGKKGAGVGGGMRKKKSE